jgi:hypothetical protein
MIELRRFAVVAFSCIAFVCAAAVPSTASAAKVKPLCDPCHEQVISEEGADVHSSPGGSVIGWVEVETEVYVFESADKGIWCNVKFENGPNKGNGGWVLCEDLGDGF